jgi:hypothetical protein
MKEYNASMSGEIYIFVENKELPIPAPDGSIGFPGDDGEKFYTVTVDTSVSMADFNKLRRVAGLPMALLTYATQFRFGGRQK